MVDITAYGHFQRPCQRFEDAFYLVVFVVAFSLDVQIHLGSIAETLEKVEEHLCGHFTNALATELSIPYEPGTATEVETDRAETVVHRQAVAVTLNAALVAKSPQQTLA